MPLARISLSSGRTVELTDLEISSTYGGTLEGYPNVRINDALIARLGRRRGPQPAHVVTPPRSYPEGEGSARLAFGPVEILPAVYCQGSFRSTCISGELDPVLHRSWLMVSWFQEDVASPVDEFVSAAVQHLHWDELAEDFEL